MKSRNSSIVSQAIRCARQLYQRRMGTRPPAHHLGNSPAAGVPPSTLEDFLKVRGKSVTALCLGYDPGSGCWCRFWLSSPPSTTTHPHTPLPSLARAHFGWLLRTGTADRDYIEMLYYRESDVYPGEAWCLTGVSVGGEFLLHRCVSAHRT